MPRDEWTIPRVIARRRRADPQVQAIVSDEGAITWAELDHASRAVASCLVRAGLKKGDRVGLLMPNGAEWATVALAVMRVGAVLVPLSTLLQPPELLAQLRLAAVDQLITVRAYRGRSYLDDLASLAPALVDRIGGGQRDPVLPALRRIWTWGELPDAPVATSLIDALEDVVRPADDMVILFTSGSRGAPKGVIHLISPLSMSKAVIRL